MTTYEKKAIFDAAIAQQTDLGWTEMTLEDLVLKTGIPLEKIRTLFPAKEELLVAVQERQVNDAFLWLRHWVAAAGTVPGKIDTFITCRNAAFRQHTGLMALARGGVDGITANGYRCLRKIFDRRQQQIVYDILAFGVRSGHLRAMEDRYLNDIAAIIVGALRGVEMSMPPAGTHIGTGNYSKVVLDMIVNGIKTDSRSITGGTR